MNIRKLIFTALLIVALALGAGLILAQDEGGDGDGREKSEKTWSGFGRRGHHGFGGRGAGMMLPGGAELMALVTEATGLEPGALHEALRGGETLAGLIEANGGDVDAFIAEAIAQVTEKANARIAERIEAMVQGEHRAAMKDMGRRGFGRGGARGFAGRGAMGPMADMAGMALEATGLEPHELFDALREGESPASLIEANDGDVEAFIAGISEAFNARVDAALADGKLTEERAELMKDGMAQRLEAMVHGEHPLREKGFDRRGWQHGDKDSDMDADEHEETETTDA